jgi:folate-binding protein YgfZ
MQPESTLRTQHEELGATFQTYFGCVLPDRYGDLAMECRRVREQVALFDTGFQAFAYFSGPDRVRYLNAMLTCNIKDLQEGQGTIGLLLSPQGHILAEVRCLGLAERLLTVFHRSVRSRTVETLERFIIMDDVTLEDATERLGSVGVEGPAAGDVLMDACGLKIEALAELGHEEKSIGGTACRIVRSSRFGESGAEIITERERLANVWKELLRVARQHGGGAIGYAAINALRLESGAPWFGYDFDDTVIPHEAGLQNSHISYTKGCYTGQEIVERVRSRGQANRVRVRLQFLGLEVPPSGTKLLAGETEIGRVTSAAFSPRFGRVLGMGYVRREQSETGTLLRWAGGEVEVA